jgi:hypothetical protein
MSFRPLKPIPYTEKEYAGIGIIEPVGNVQINVVLISGLQIQARNQRGGKHQARLKRQIKT